MPPAGTAAPITTLGVVGIVVLLLVFYGGTMWMSLAISRKKENADSYMTAGNSIGFGVSAASMTATWIWASSMYASATAGYTYGVSGPIHYGLWGALMILFIYPFGRRIRKVAPARTRSPRSCTPATAAPPSSCSPGRTCSARSSP